MQIHKLTYFVLVFIIIIGTVSIAGRKGIISSRTVSNPEPAKHLTFTQKDEEQKKLFPTAEFDEPKPTQPEKRAALEAKQKRHNGLGLVNRHPDPDSGGGAFVPEGQFDFPAFPIVKSDVVVLGEVLNAEAHLSEDKTNVFSEFRVRVERVLKPYTNLPNGSTITIERIGGFVKYPDGRKLLYRLGFAGMPRVGGRYVFFLKSIPESKDYTILTGYEFGERGVSPLDSSAQFEAYTGYDEIKFLNAINEALAQSPPP